MLGPVYAALGLDWEPSASGSVHGGAGAAWDSVRDALVTEYAREYEIVGTRSTRALEKALAPNAQRRAPR